MHSCTDTCMYCTWFCSIFVSSVFTVRSHDVQLCMWACITNCLDTMTYINTFIALILANIIQAESLL